MNFKLIFINLKTMNSTLTEYIEQIRQIVPDYETPKRGRGQCSLLSSLRGEKKERFLFLENKIKLEKNRLAAKFNRKKKKNRLEFLIDENDELKLKIKSLDKDNFSLSGEVSFLKKEKSKLQSELVSLRKKNLELEKRLSLDEPLEVEPLEVEPLEVEPLEVENFVPIKTDWPDIMDFENCSI